jgi:hypothetical protein
MGNWTEQFSNEKIQVANKYMTLFQSSGKMQIKTTLRFHLTPVKMAIKKTKQMSMRMWKKSNLYTLLAEM